MKWEKIIGLFILCMLLICGCAPRMPFSAQLAGTYEIATATEGIQRLDIQENGNFSADTIQGHAQLDQGQQIHFRYADGETLSFTYQKSDYRLELQSNEASYTYMDSNAFTQWSDRDIPVGLYADTCGSILMDIQSPDNGVLYSTHSGDIAPFSYHTRDGIIRLAYTLEPSYEYMHYTMVDGALHLSPLGDQSPIQLYPASSLSLWGDYALLYHQGDDPHFTAHIGEDFQAMSFPPALLMVPEGEGYHPYHVTTDGVLTTFQSLVSDDSYTYMHESIFFNDAQSLKRLSGVYATEDLSLIMHIRPDGDGQITEKGVASSATYTLRQGWLKCQSHDTAYYHVRPTKSGLYMAEAASGADERSDYIFLRKLH